MQENIALGRALATGGWNPGLLNFVRKGNETYLSISYSFLRSHLLSDEFCTLKF